MAGRDYCEVCGSGVAVRELEWRDLELACRVCRLSSVLGRTCPLCGFQLRPSDPLAQVERGRADGGGWAHMACTREGVKRWCRENRPLETTARRGGRHPPLFAARVLGWRWHDRPRDARRVHLPPVARASGERANAATTSGP